MRVLQGFLRDNARSLNGRVSAIRPVMRVLQAIKLNAASIRNKVSAIRPVMRVLQDGSRSFLLFLRTWFQQLGP